MIPQMATTSQQAPNLWVLAAILGPFALWLLYERRKKNRVIASGSAPPGAPPAQGPPPAATGEAAFRAKLEKAFRENGPLLSATLTAEGKKKAMVTWHESLRQLVPDYVALKSGHPAAEQLMQLEVDHYMRAYLCGALAREGKLAETDALEVGYLLGRELREGLRARRVPLETLSANLGSGLDKSFAAVVQAGWGKS